MVNKDFKAKLLAECKKLLGEKINTLSFALSDVLEASNSESKSSAGDKHETGKAMMQIEQEKLSKQLSELKTQKNELDKIGLNTSTSNIGPGSLVETDKGMFYIAVSLGKVKLEASELFVISPLSSMGVKLISAREKYFALNNTAYIIRSVI